MHITLDGQTFMAPPGTLIYRRLALHLRVDALNYRVNIDVSAQ